MDKRFGASLGESRDFSGKIREKLRELNITTGEELVALAVIPGARKGLATHLGITEAEVTKHIDKVRKGMTGRMVAAMEEPYTETLEMGAMEPPAETRVMPTLGPYETAVSPAALPPNVNFIPRFRPVQNQASRGTCVSFACTALNEDYYRNAPGGVPNLSEQCLYLRCKENDGIPNANGTFVSVGMDCLVRFGQSTENCEPYNPNPPTNQPAPHMPCCGTESPQWKVSGSMKLNQNSVTDIKGALADGRVVAFSIPVFNSWYQSAAVRRTGNLTMPLPGEANAGGHAMLFVGYQDDAQTPGGGYFILRNSWGSAWASANTYGAGYGTIPYQYMIDRGWEAFTFVAPLVICPPRPIVPPCPPRPVLSCPPRPVLSCPPRPIVLPCPPRPVLSCPPRPIRFCPPGPRIACPPGPMPIPPIPPEPRPPFRYYPSEQGYYPEGYADYGYPQAYYPEAYSPSYYPEGSCQCGSYGWEYDDPASYGNQEYDYDAGAYPSAFNPQVKVRY